MVGLLAEKANKSLKFEAPKSCSAVECSTVCPQTFGREAVRFEARAEVQRARPDPVHDQKHARGAA